MNILQVEKLTKAFSQRTYRETDSVKDAFIKQSALYEAWIEELLSADDYEAARECIINRLKEEGGNK